MTDEIAPDVLEFPEGNFDSNQLTSMLSKILQAVNALSTAKKPEDYPYPPKDKEKSAELQKENDELKEKLGVFEKQGKEAKITEYLDLMEEKGLVKPEQRGDFSKEYENFSLEQIDTLIDSSKKMDFSSAKKKSFKAPEVTDDDKKDFKKKEGLVEKIQDLRDANVGGPVLDDLEAQLKSMEVN